MPFLPCPEPWSLGQSYFASLGFYSSRKALELSWNLLRTHSHNLQPSPRLYFLELLLLSVVLNFLVNIHGKMWIL